MSTSWIEDRVPFSDDVGDIYFTSGDDAYGAAKYLFIEAVNLSSTLSAKKSIRVCELGFGTGLNILTLAKFLEGRDGLVEAVSIEHNPMAADAIKKALSPWPDLHELTDRLLEQYPKEKKVSFGSLNLEIIPSDVLTALDGLVGSKFDVWILDGFDPKKNPAMWSLEVMQKIKSLSAEDAVLSTWCSASSVRKNLEAAGFKVQKIPGYGRKRESIVAS